MSAIVAIYKPCYNFAIGELNKKKDAVVKEFEQILKYIEFYINLYKNRNMKRWNKKLKKLFGNFITRDIYGNLFINCEEIKVSQGWFFKDKVFKAKESIWYSTTKKKSKELLYKLIDDEYKIGREVKKEEVDPLKEAEIIKETAENLTKDIFDYFNQEFLFGLVNKNQIATEFNFDPKDLAKLKFKSKKEFLEIIETLEDNKFIFEITW